MRARPLRANRRRLDNGAGKNPFKEGNNPFKDVQNILGFLLAGFGGIISFLGLQSTEVTTVLRNDPVPASVVAAILTAGMLAAVLTVVINSEVAHAVAWPIVIAIGCLLIALGGLLVYSIPASATPSVRSEVTAGLFFLAGFVLGWYRLPAKRRTPAVARIVTASARKSVLACR